MKKLVAIIFLVALVALLAWRIYQKTKPTGKTTAPGGRRSAAMPVEDAHVEKGTVRDVAQFTGSLQARSYFIVAPKVPGRLEKLLVNVGDAVRRGQVIAQLDDQEYAQQVEQARAELEVARAQAADYESAFAIAGREFERIAALSKKGIASESELDAARAQYQAAEAKCKVAAAQVQQKEAALKAAQVRLSYTRIAAAWEEPDEVRFVGERFVDEGAMLAANAPIVSILDLSTLLAVVHVIERDYPKLAIGQAAVLSTDAFPERTFVGRVVRIAPLLRETSRQARVEIEVPNPDRLLKPGMYVRAQIEFARREDATLVPTAALVRRNGKPGVFVIDPATRKVRFVAVTTGVVSSQHTEILSPPLSGRVVTLGHHLLEDGATVILPEEAAPSSAAAVKGAAAKGRQP